MANIQRKQFTFYVSFYETVKQFRRAADREKFLMAIIEYALFEKSPENLPEGCNAAFISIKPVLDKARKRAEAGKCGGSAECKQAEANGKQNESNRKQQEANDKLVRERERGGERDREREGYEQNGSNDPLMRLWSAYPGNRRDPFETVAQAAAGMHLTDEDISRAASNLVLWKKSMDWTRDNGKYIPGLIKWLESGKWVSPPPAAQLTSNPFLAMAIEEGCYDQG